MTKATMVHLLDVIDEFNANFRIISESNGTQTIDANKMKEYYKKQFKFELIYDKINCKYNLRNKIRRIYMKNKIVLTPKYI